MCGIYHWRTVLDTFGEDWKASDSETVVNPGANSFADGNYRVRVGQASGIGLDPLWAENYFHVDSTEPTTAIDLGPNLYNNNAAATMHFEFSGTDLWGPDSDPTVTVCVDAWEPYLEAAS